MIALGASTLVHRESGHQSRGCHLASTGLYSKDMAHVGAPTHSRYSLSALSVSVLSQRGGFDLSMTPLRHYFPFNLTVDAYLLLSLYPRHRGWPTLPPQTFSSTPIPRRRLCLFSPSRTF